MKIIDKEEVKSLLKDGMTIMIGGFMSNGTSEILIDALIEKDVKDLTIIANDTGTPDTGIARLVAHGSIKKLIASHIGLNPMTGQLKDRSGYGSGRRERNDCN